MSQLSKRIESFVSLGQLLNSITSNSDNTSLEKHKKTLNEAIEKTCMENPWFSPESYKTAIQNITEWLTTENITRWLNPYNIEDNNTKTVAIIMAGNIPLVGFHDFLSVLITGNNVLAKLSHNDKNVLPVISQFLKEIDSNFNNKISFTDEKLENFDAIIATGSNNSAKYFDYYFRKYPNIIRKNRSSVAYISGEEKDEDLILLGNDLFDYYGLGCRNVSKIFIPDNYKIENFFDLLRPWKMLIDKSKYYNNYTYHKAIFLLNSDKFFDTEFALFIERSSIQSPLAVYNYERYKSLDDVKRYLDQFSESIQCVVGAKNNLFTTIPFGKSQKPELWDYADGVDTIIFLLSITQN